MVSILIIFHANQFGPCTIRRSFFMPRHSVIHPGIPSLRRFIWPPRRPKANSTLATVVSGRFTAKLNNSNSRGRSPLTLAGRPGPLGPIRGGPIVARPPDPADVRVGGRRPDPSARFQPAVRLPIPFRPLPRYHLLGLRRRARGADQILLVDQAQDRHRGPVSARISAAEARTHGQDRMEEESLLPFLRTSDRSQARHRLLAMGEGRKGRVLDEQIPPASATRPWTRRRGGALDPIGRDLRPVEEIVSGVGDLCSSSGEQFGDHLGPAQALDPQLDTSRSRRLGATGCTQPV